MSESLNRVAGGHKAAMHNPNVSAEAKEHSRQVVEEIEGSDAARVQVDSSTKQDFGYNLNEESRVIGGYKATLKSTSIFPWAVPMTCPIFLLYQRADPNVGEEAKERAQQILERKDAL